MKMVKKILLGLAVAGLIAGTMSCKMGDDEDLKATGSKWDRKAEVDHKTKYTDKDDYLYARAWQQLGDNETVTKLKTTLVAYTENVDSEVWLSNENENGVDLKDAKYSVKDSGLEKKDPDPSVVVGLMVDLHETTKDVTENNKTSKKKFYDFVLIGYRPKDNKYYVEHYKNVPKGAFEEHTSNGDLFEGSKAENFETLPNTSYNGAFFTTPLDTSYITVDETAKTKSFDITVTQSALANRKGTYTINLGGKNYTYTRNATEDEVKKGALMGGAAIYANAPLGTIAKLEAHSDKDNTVGLFEEVEE